eukprot:s1971_g11.t1
MKISACLRLALLAAADALLRSSPSAEVGQTFQVELEGDNLPVRAFDSEGSTISPQTATPRAYDDVIAALAHEEALKEKESIHDQLRSSRSAALASITHSDIARGTAAEESDLSLIEAEELQKQLEEAKMSLLSLRRPAH